MNLSLETMVEVIIAIAAVSLIILFVYGALFEKKNCEGIAPLNDGNALIGFSEYPSGYSPTSWSYDLGADGSKACLWKCINGSIKSGNACVPIN